MQPLQIKAPEIKAPQDFRLQMKPSGSVAQTYKAPVQQSGLDSDVVRLAKAIRQHETGNQPKAGATGEMVSRYQFMPGTWKSWAGQILGDPNAPTTLENENKVAYAKLKEWKDKGYTGAQSAAAWNAGEGSIAGDAWKQRIGTSSTNPNVQYNTPKYVASVGSIYQQLKAQEPQTPQGEIEQDVPAPKQDGILASMGKGLVSGLVNPFTAPAAGFVSGVTGKDVNLPWYLGGAQISSSGTKEGFERTARSAGKAALDTAGLMATGGAVRASVPLFKGTATLGKTMASEAIAGGLGGAAYGAGATMGEDGTTTKDILTSGLIGGALGAPVGAAAPLIGAGVSKAVKPVIESVAGKADAMAGRMLGSILRVTSKDFAHGKNPLEQMAREGITGKTVQEIKTATINKTNEIGVAIRKQLSAVPPTVRINVSDITSIIDKKIADLSSMGESNKPIINALQKLKTDVGKAIGNNPNKTAEEAWLLKETIETAQPKGLWAKMSDQAASAKDDVFKSIDQTISSRIKTSVPSMTELFERYGNMATAKKIVNRTELAVKKGEATSPVVKQAFNQAKLIRGFGGATTGFFASGMNPLGALAGYIVENQIEKLASNPGVITKVASWISRAGRKELEDALTANPTFIENFIEAVPKLRATGNRSVQKAVDTIQTILSHQGEMSKAKEDIAGEGVKKAFQTAETVFPKGKPVGTGKNAVQMQSEQSAAGGMLGLKMEKDEEGKMKVGYDPKLGALGAIGGMVIGRKAKDFEDLVKKGKIRSHITPYDDLIRGEISDANAKILPKGMSSIESGETIKLVDILEHDVLFEQYPELKNLKISTDERMPIMRSGVYNRGTNTITLNPNAINRETLLHEIQHAVQSIDDYSYMKSGSLGNSRYHPAETEAGSTQKRIDMSQEEINAGTKRRRDEIDAYLLEKDTEGRNANREEQKQAYDKRFTKLLKSEGILTDKTIGGFAVSKVGSKVAPKVAQEFTGLEGLSTKTLEKLKGRTTVSKEFIQNLTNQPDLKQTERDIIRNVLETEGATVNVKDFAKKVQTELLPLTTLGYGKFERAGFNKYEGITLPENVRGNVKNYKEIIYRSPVKTSAGDVHFRDADVDNYFGHTRIEDMADNRTRRVIEVQSDLYQKGNLEKENPMDESAKLKLQQYNDPTAHFRMIREEVKKAAEDGKTKLQFPTGETAMDVEGLGEELMIEIVRGGRNTGETLVPRKIKVGMELDSGGNYLVITEVLGEGKFKAVQKMHLENEWDIQRMELGDDFDEVAKLEDGIAWAKKNNMTETFDISGELYLNDPIYKFYEKDVAKYLKNKYGAKQILDDNGVSWMEVEIKPEYKKMPVEAFGILGAIGLGASQKSESKEESPMLPLKQ